MESSASKKCFVFDLDETLFTFFRCRVNKVNTEKSTSEFLNTFHKTILTSLEGCFIINKSTIADLLQNIAKNGDAIAFVTAGSYGEEFVQELLRTEFGLEVGFYLYNSRRIKADALKSLAEEYGGPENIIFFDNGTSHIDEAKRVGIANAIYVDTNSHDESDGAEYINKLKEIVKSRAEEVTRFIEPDNYLARNRCCLFGCWASICGKKNNSNNNYVNMDYLVG